MIKVWSPIGPSYAVSALGRPIEWWFFPKRLSRRGQPLWCLAATSNARCHLWWLLRLHEIPGASAMPHSIVPLWRKSCWGEGSSTPASWQQPCKGCRWCCTLQAQESSNVPSCKMRQSFQAHGYGQGPTLPAAACAGRHRCCLLLLYCLKTAFSIASPPQRPGCFQTQKSCSETQVPGG